MKQQKKLRIGIVSANWGALAHLPAWRELRDDVEVTAICTSRQETAEAAAIQFNVPRPFSSYEAMCADPDIDIIDAGTTPILREKIVAAALRGGKHVINQLPFATSGAAAEQLVELQRQQGVVGAAAASIMGLPHLALMKEMIDGGYVGDIYQVNCSWQLALYLDIIPGFSYSWFRKAGLGVSVARNFGSHMLHAMRHIAGPLASVASNIDTKLDTWFVPNEGRLPVETEDTCHALVKFANGASGSLLTSWTAADSPGYSLEVLGSKGRLKLSALRYPDMTSAKLYASKGMPTMTPSGEVVEVPDRLLSLRGQKIEQPPLDPTIGGQHISITRLFDHFVQAIVTGSEPLAGFERSLEVQNLVDAMYLSNTTRSWVDIGPEGKAIQK